MDLIAHLLQKSDVIHFKLWDKPTYCRNYQRFFHLAISIFYE